MNNFKNNFIKVLFGILVFTSVLSCDEGGDPSREEIGFTNTGQYAGQWYVTLTDTEGATLVEHQVHSTYNTAANDNTMWIDDHEHVIISKVNFQSTLLPAIFQQLTR